MATLTSFFAQRVKNTIRGWPSVMRRDLRAVLRLSLHQSVHAPRLHSRRYDQPYWILLPFWLAEHYRRCRMAAAFERGFLNDILWGQYCMFAFIRLQDDLFDGQTDRTSLIYASDMFLVESERIFSKYFPKVSPFWCMYRNCIRGTLLSIVLGDTMERTPASNPGKLLEAHGATAAICGVASAAVCFRAGDIGTIKRVSRYSSEMMKAGAILDDLQDMEEDIGRAHFNYATTFFVRNVRTGTRRTSVAHGPAGLRRDGLSRLFREVHYHLDRAEIAMQCFAVPAAVGYLHSYRASVVTAETRLRRMSDSTMIGETISHYRVLERLGVARQRSDRRSFVGVAWRRVRATGKTRSSGERV